MRKIPTLFERDPEDRKHVLPTVTPGCEWVVARGEGTATRKYDGTCMMFDGTRWWARREVKPGKNPPTEWVEVDADETTGKRVGWEPAEQTGWVKYLDEAGAFSLGWNEGTYELIGPKVNGNPEQMTAHILLAHGLAVLEAFPTTYVDIRAAFDDEWPTHWEGVVWHHPDGSMAKIKRRDFA